jgi:hypothetical protein
MTDPQTKRQRYIGCFTSEEDAARAYDRAAVEAGKPDTKRNFPDEDISEPPVSSGGVRKRKNTSSSGKSTGWRCGKRGPFVLGPTGPRWSRKSWPTWCPLWACRRQRCTSWLVAQTGGGVCDTTWSRPCWAMEQASRRQRRPFWAWRWQRK